VVEDEKTEDTEIIRTDGAERRHLRLLVAGEGVYAMHALPDAGDVLIGRSERADVSIDDPLISRRHAILHIGERIVLEDLGSANGVRVRDTQLSPNATVEVRPGDAIDAGSTTLIVQRGVASRRDSRRSARGPRALAVCSPCCASTRAARWIPPRCKRPSGASCARWT
jgi:hypothetical protein